MDTSKINTYYFQVTDLWKRLCEEHFELFNLTCDEYACLLESNIDELDAKISEKDLVIKTIGRLEGLRQEIIRDLNKSGCIDMKIDSVRDLLSIMTKTEPERKGKYLERFNLLLVDLIGKIQQQNKRNQAFINKALKSLREIREEVTGEKSYQTYTSKGSAQTSSTRKE
jgi:flagellar biosynthesis/type III secretory pathway chaperone